VLLVLVVIAAAAATINIVQFLCCHCNSYLSAEHSQK